MIKAVCFHHTHLPKVSIHDTHFHTYLTCTFCVPFLLVFTSTTRSSGRVGFLADIMPTSSTQATPLTSASHRLATSQRGAEAVLSSCIGHHPAHFQFRLLVLLQHPDRRFIAPHQAPKVRAAELVKNEQLNNVSSRNQLVDLPKVHTSASNPFVSQTRTVL